MPSRRDRVAMKSPADRTLTVTSVPADPDKWSEQSKRSEAYVLWTAYKDIAYQCRHCGRDAVFTGAEQKHAFEVRQVYVWQRRTLCSPCWEAARAIDAQLRACEARWADARDMLRTDGEFLAGWLALMKQKDKYAPGRANTAVQSMLQTLIDRLNDTGS